MAIKGEGYPARSPEGTDIFSWNTSFSSFQQQYSMDIQSVLRMMHSSSSSSTETKRLFWNGLLAGLAALDFGAAMARRHGGTFLTVHGSSSPRHENLNSMGSRRHDTETVDDWSRGRVGAHTLPVLVPLLVPVVQWLCRTASIWSLLFALMWFIDALIGARQFRDAAQRRKDQHRLHLLRTRRHALQRQRLLLERGRPNAAKHDIISNNSSDASNTTLESTSAAAAVLIEEPTTPLETLLGDVKILWMQSEPTVRYYRTMALQIMLLPLGFFVALYQPILWLWRHVRHDHQHDNFDIVATVVHSIQSYSTTILPGHFYTSLQHPDDHIVSDLSRCYTAIHEHDLHNHLATNLDIGLGFAIVQRTFVWLAYRTGTVVRLSAVSHGYDLMQTLLVRALYHPIRFNRRIRTFLRLVRWIQYLGPLIGTFNKLVGNILNVVSKYKQRRARLQVQKKLFVATPPPLNDDTCRMDNEVPRDPFKDSEATPSPPKVQAANQIQAFLRQQLQAGHIHQQELLLEELVVETWKRPNDKATRAAVTIQRACRSALHRVRNRYHERLLLLHSLQEKERLSHHHRYSNRRPMRRRNTKRNATAGTSAEGTAEQTTTMTIEERRRMYVLQEELESEAQSWINEKLLLRPNTTFAVLWKILFVVAVIFEISALAFQPIWARQHKDSITGKALDLEAILDRKLIPTPVFKLDVCKSHQTVNSKLHFNIWYPLQSTRQVLRTFGLQVYNEIVKHKATARKQRPWFCNGFFSRLQAVYITLANLAVHHFFVVLSIVCFVDVYIEFFTGQYDSVTGKLVPPPFFVRFIFPGLLLQLLVNPEMDTVSEIATHSVAGLLHHGPERIARWTLALFYPALVCVARIVRWFWLGYTRHQNCRLWYRISSPGEATARE